MGKISENIVGEIREAMKVGDKIKLSTLKLLSSALSYEKIAQQRVLTDDEEIKIVKSEVKKRKDAMVAYKEVGSPERAEIENKEMLILLDYLPEEMSDDDLEKIVDATLVEIGDVKPESVGKAIGAVMEKTKGQVDGSRVSEMIRQKVSTGK